jgi:uroporphyrinogen decarboxylase
MHEQPALLDRLLRVNEEFCVAWANAQIAAGAAAIGYADPVSSPTIVPRELYLKTGFPAAKRTIARIKGPVATSFASGRCLSILDDVAQTGTVGVGVSALEDLAAAKAACRGRLTVMGNLNAIEMRRWTPAEAELKVKEAIAAAGPGGGYVLTDNHGEIPWQVPDDILSTMADAVCTWGRYPLRWVEEHGR